MDEWYYSQLLIKGFAQPLYLGMSKSNVKENANAM